MSRKDPVLEPRLCDPGVTPVTAVWIDDSSTMRIPDGERPR